LAEPVRGGGAPRPALIRGIPAVFASLWDGVLVSSRAMTPKFPTLALLAAALLSAPAVFADVNVKLSDVHLCCTSCVKGVDKAMTSVAGATATCDRENETVTIAAADQATAQKAVDALVTAGYFGTSSDPAVKVSANTGATDANVHAMTVNGVHLCCNKCVKAVNTALAKVPGVKANTANKDSSTFEVTGEFKPTDVFAALQSAGLTGTQAKAE
jgi:copper chaperone CopZ